MRRNPSRRPCRRKALSVTSDGQLGSTMRRKRRIRIVLDGLRSETSIAELCRREGIAESMSYSWSKEFLEAGKRRLAGDTARAAATDEVKQLRTAGGVDGMNLEPGRAILDEMRPGPRSRNSSIATNGRWETC